MCTIGLFAQDMLLAMGAFSMRYFTTVNDLCLVLLVTWTMVYLAWSILGLAMGRPQDPKQFVTTILITIICNGILVNPTMLWQFLGLFVDIAVYAGGHTFMDTTAATPQDFGSMVCYATHGYDNALGEQMNALLQDMSITHIGRALLIILMYAASLTLIYKVIKYMADPVSGLFAIYVLAPFIVLLVAAEPTRRSGLVAIKMMIANVFELVITCSVTAIFMAMVATVSKNLPISSTGGLVTGGEDWLGSPSYWFVLFAVVFFFFTFDRMVSVAASLTEIIVTHSTFQMGLPKLPGK